MPVKSGSLPTATIPELAQEYGVGVGTIWRSLQPHEVAAT
jgi:hypothetical protein